MMDKLRKFKFAGEVPVGTPVTFQGNVIGEVVNSKNGISECGINNDIIYSMIREEQASFSLEVRRK